MLTKKKQFNTRKNKNVEYLFFSFTLAYTIKIHNLILVFSSRFSHVINTY